MKVLMTADTVGGVWTYALGLANALAPDSVQVFLATMGGPITPAQREEAQRIPGLELHESSYKLEWMEEPWEDVKRAGEWLLELEAKIKPDIVHLNGYAHGALPWRAPTLVVGHSCVLSWWEGVRGEAAPAEWQRYSYRVARGLRAAGLVVAPTQAMLNALRKHYGISGGKVIYNAQDPGFFTLTTPKENFVLSVGRLWDQAKNVAALASVAPCLSWPVYVAGEERHPGGGSAHLGGVHTLGYISSRELAGWFARASIYTLPARYEPFGLSALEAALSRCALVLGDIPSLREVWGAAALFVPPDDSAALHNTIDSLIADAPRRSALAELAYRRALHFAPERMAAAYLQAYRRLTAQDRYPAQEVEVPTCAS